MRGRGKERNREEAAGQNEEHTQPPLGSPHVFLVTPLLSLSKSKGQLGTSAWLSQGLPGCLDLWSPSRNDTFS